MPVPPDRGAGNGLSRLIGEVRRRTTLLHAASAAALGLASTAVLLLVRDLVDAPLLFVWAAVCAGAVAAVVLFMRLAAGRTPRSAALAIEGVRPDSRNVIVTAEELSRQPDRAEPFIRTRVLAAADGLVEHISAPAVIPAVRLAAPICVAMGSAAALLIVAAQPSRVRDAYERITSALPGVHPADWLDVTVTVTPPAYLAEPAQRLHNPERLEAIEGTRLSFESRTSGMRVRFGKTPLAGNGHEHTVTASGYFALEGDGPAERRLIPLRATPDGRPSVRIETPGQDLFIATTDRSIPITAMASDDLALRSLELRFTKITGSGEQFEFEEGTLPVTVERRSEREWKASGSLALGGMKLVPGDSLVYRAVSRDRRPGNDGLASSDTYIVEILGPGQAALEGVETPPELERYGLSQQMIVLKLERLRAEEPRLPREALVEQLASLSAEQRTVRANFIFLLGGHVEDEFEEAEHSHEIQEGRLENTARREINTAIAHMTRSAESMTAVNTGAALSAARQAVTALQRAFGRSRYLLRSLAVRSRLDPSRRLTGDLSSASDWRRTAGEASQAPGAAQRQLLDALLDMGRRWSEGAKPAATEINGLAEGILAVAPADPGVIEASRALLGVDAQGSAEQARQTIAGAAAQLIRTIERSTLPAIAVPPKPSPVRRAYDREDGR